jgi:hypothetical protein
MSEQEYRRRVAEADALTARYRAHGISREDYIRAICKAWEVAFKASRPGRTTPEHRAHLPQLAEIARRGLHAYDGANGRPCSVCGHVDNTLNLSYHLTAANRAGTPVHPELDGSPLRETEPGTYTKRRKNVRYNGR